MPSSMSNPHFHEMILTTKISLPAIQRKLVARSRLIEQLNEGLAQRKLVLIQAPAGFGKTTLLQQWLGVLPYPIAWFALDEADNAPLSFLTYCIASLQRAQPTLHDEATLQFLTAPDTLSIERLLATLLNRLAELPDCTVLVFDDYHAIHEPAIHKVLNRFINYLPPQVKLVLATRTRPPFSLAHLRGRGELFELGSEDLRFTSDEIFTYLSQVTQLKLSETHTILLESRTRGWIAALQMVALSLRSQKAATIDRLMQAIKGDSVIIAGYLAEEVFQRQLAEVQNFLLKTSILDRLCGSLCSVVLGGAISALDSQAQLEALERANLFTSVLDEQAVWYSYHPLFAEFLRQRLLRTYPEEAPGLHAQASQWYQEQGFHAEAIDHALAADDFRRAARLISKIAQTTLWQGLASANVVLSFDLVEQVTRSMLLRGEVANLMRWLGTLPETTINSHPRLWLWYAWVNLVIGDYEVAELHLTKMEGVCTAHRRKGLFGEAAGIRASIAMLRGDWSRASELCQRALDYLPARSEMIRNVATVNLGVIQMINGGLTEARATLADLRKSKAQQKYHFFVSITALLKMAELRARQGRLYQAASHYYQILQVNDDEQMQLSRTLGAACLGLSQVLYEWNNLEAAQKYVNEGIALSEVWQEANALLRGYITLACIKDAQQDTAGTLKSLHQACEIGMNMLSLDRVPIRSAACWARLQLKYELRGEKMVGSQWDVSRSGQMLLARLLLGSGRVEEALHLLDPLGRAAEAAGRFDAAIQILVLQAVAFQTRKNPGSAMKRLNHALMLAEGGGYIRIFVEEVSGLAALLETSLTTSLQSPTTAHPPTSPYVSRILLTLDADALQKREPSSATLTVLLADESLSPREMEVLELLVAGKSNADIAQALDISVGTAKLHLHHIYNKLEVHSRTEAIAKVIQAEQLRSG